MRPEDEARREIDDLLAACGWDVQDYQDMNISAAEGVAVREFPLAAGFGFADYLLYAQGRAIGVIEAKPKGHTLTGVESQSEKYTVGLPDAAVRESRERVELATRAQIMLDEMDIALADKLKMRVYADISEVSVHIEETKASVGGTEVIPRR